MHCHLAEHTPRRRNLAALEIGRHLIGDGNGRYIVIPAAETKTSTPIEFAIPALLLPYLDIYLAVVRPRLLRARHANHSGSVPAAARYVMAQSAISSRGTLLVFWGLRLTLATPATPRRRPGRWPTRARLKLPLTCLLLCTRPDDAKALQSCQGSGSEPRLCRDRP